MPTIPWGQVNVWAVLVAGMATFFLGGAWYTALFGKAWVRLHGYTPEQVAAMQKARPPHVFFSVMVVSYLVLAYIIAVLAAWAGVGSVGGGVMLGLLLWIGPAMCIGATAFIASNKPLGAFAIDWAYQFVFLLMMGAIIGGWR